MTPPWSNDGTVALHIDDVVLTIEPNERRMGV
jgi:hypothetical protein